MHQSPVQQVLSIFALGLTLIFADGTAWSASPSAPDGMRSSDCDSAIVRQLPIFEPARPPGSSVAVAPPEESRLPATSIDRNECVDARSPKVVRATQTMPEPPYPDPSGDKTPQDIYEALRETGTETMSEAIVYLRDLALKKAKPLPQKIRQQVAPYFSAELLQKARYVTDWSPAIGAALRQFLDTDRYAMAVTLDHVIVFADRESLDNLWLWIHELKHVEQYERWGIKTFAGNYLLDHQKVEREADEYAARVLAKIRR